MDCTKRRVPLASANGDQADRWTNSTSDVLSIDGGAVPDQKTGLSRHRSALTAVAPRSHHLHPVLNPMSRDRPRGLSWPDLAGLVPASPFLPSSAIAT